MRDKLIELLTTIDPNEVDDGTLRQVRSFFGMRFSELLYPAVRNHPLGFFYASEEIEAGLHLRYHFWPSTWSMPTLEQGKEDHDHTYHLSSMIVIGELRHKTFEAVDDPAGTHEVLVVGYRSVDSVLNPTGRRVRVTCSGDERYSAGKRYQLSPGTIHRAVPTKLPTATIVVTRDAGDGMSPRVFARAGETAALSMFHRGPLTTEQIQLVASELSTLF